MMTAAGLAQAKPTEAQAKAFKNNIVTYLQQLGFRAFIDSDGDVEFKQDGASYWVLADPYDNGYYVRVMYQASITNFNYIDVLKANNETMQDYKYGRCYTVNSNKSNRIETTWYCATIGDFKVFFENANSVVTLCVEDWKGKIGW